MIVTTKFDRYTTEEIQELLNSGLFKKEIAKEIGVCTETLDRYIEKHKLTYSCPPKKKVKELEKQETYVTINEKPRKGELINPDPFYEIQNPEENFRRIFEERKRKRMIQELKDWCY